MVYPASFNQAYTLKVWEILRVLYYHYLLFWPFSHLRFLSVLNIQTTLDGTMVLSIQFALFSVVCLPFSLSSDIKCPKDEIGDIRRLLQAQNERILKLESENSPWRGITQIWGIKWWTWPRKRDSYRTRLFISEDNCQKLKSNWCKTKPKIRK